MIAAAVGLLVMAAAYGGVAVAVAGLPMALPSAAAMVGLHAGLTIAAPLLWRRTSHRFGALRWLYSAALAVIGAALLIGAEGALDTLNGAHRPKARVAASLGGLELWFVLCPGVFALALGGAAREALAARR